MKRLWKELWDLIKRPSFALPLILTLAIGYGYFLTHTVVGVDDLQGYIYWGDRLGLRTGRFWSWIFAVRDTNFYFLRSAVSFLTLSFSAPLWCVLLKRASGDRLRPGCYTAFACLLVSCPLMVSAFSFQTTALCVGVGYALTAVELLMMDAFLAKRSVKAMLAMTLLSWVAVSSIESMAVVHVMGTFMYLLLKGLYGLPEQRKAGCMLRTGLWFALPLAGGILLNRVVVWGALKLWGLAPAVYAGAAVQWGGGSVGQTLKSTLLSILRNYGYMGLHNLGIGAMQLACVVGLALGMGYVVREKRPGLLLPMGGMLLSLVLLPFIGGMEIPYRASQQVGLFTAFSLTLLLQWALECWKRPWLRAFAVCALSALCLAQGVNQSAWFRLRGRAYEQNVAVTAQILSDLRDKTRAGDKAVVFLGGYQPSEQIWDKLTVHVENPRLRFLFPDAEEWPADVRISDISIADYLTWAQFALTGYGYPGDEAFYRWLEYLGYDQITRCTPEQFEQACRLCPGLPSYPEEGYITQAQDFILVKLGPLYED